MMIPKLLLKEVTLPPGSLIAYAGKIATDDSSHDTGSALIVAWGWMICDGSSLQVSEYPELFQALGYLYGGSGNSFNLPNLEGQFLRGVGTQPAVLEDRSSAPGGEANGVGSTQEFALQQHIHVYEQPLPPAKNNNGIVEGEAVLASNPTAATSGPLQAPPAVQGNVKVSQLETRPTNTLVYYLIKYTSKLPSFDLPQLS